MFDAGLKEKRIPGLMNARGRSETINLWLSVTRSWHRKAHRGEGKLFGDDPCLLAFTTPRGILGEMIEPATKGSLAEQATLGRRSHLPQNRLG